MGKLNDWRSRRRVRSKTSPKTLTAEISRQAVLRLLLLGLTTREIADRLHKTPGQIRRMTNLPAFQAEYAQLQRDLLAGLDQKISQLLVMAVFALKRQLRHPNPKWRDAAIEKVMRMHGKFFDRIDLTGQIQHSGLVTQQHQHTHTQALSDTDRQMIMAYLRATRDPRQQPLMLSKIGHTQEGP